MPRASFRQLLRYRFDSFMARGGLSIFLSLVLIFLGSLTVVGLLRGLLLWIDPGGTDQRGLLAHVFVAFLQLTDPGNMGLEIPSSMPYKAAAVVAGTTGVIIFSALIAFITTALDQKLNALKKGHSKVIEEGHTLILGWSDRVLEILRELIFANESEESPCVVILAERDKEQMDDELALHLPDTRNTRVVTRSGRISSLVNLEIVSVTASKSVIVLARCTDAARREDKMASDTRVIKTVLGVIASRESPEQRFNIVAEIFDERNRQLARAISPAEVTTVFGLEVLAKIMVQTSRSIGLSVVYGEIMSFDGSELYFHHSDWGEAGFDELSFRFPDGVPLGIRRADGELLLNPPPGTRVHAADDLLLLAEDDSTIELRSAPVAVPRDLPLSGGRLVKRVENELILGWSPKAPLVIEQYADYVLAGSSISVMVRQPGDEVRRRIQALRQRLAGLEIRLIDQDPLDVEALIEARPFLYDNIIILSQSGEVESSETMDSQTILLLLQLRRIADEAPAAARGTKLISEVMDSENQDLVARAGVNDFIISNRLVSMLLAQVSEEADIFQVYENLFQEDGSEIYLKPAHFYLDRFPAEVTFADLMGLARRRSEICLGIKIKADEKDAAKNYGIRLVPEKNTRYTFTGEDSLIVLAEDET